MIITIDGPVASGKSTAARNLARVLGFDHLDTGALYRSLALMAVEEGIDPRDGGAVAEMMERARVGLAGERVFLCGRDVSDLIGARR